MSYFKAKMHKIRCRLGLGRTWELTALLRPLAGFKGAYNSKGKRERGMGDKEREGVKGEETPKVPRILALVVGNPIISYLLCTKIGRLVLRKIIEIVPPDVTF